MQYRSIAEQESARPALRVSPTGKTSIRRPSWAFGVHVAFGHEPARTSTHTTSLALPHPIGGDQAGSRTSKTPVGGTSASMIGHPRAAPQRQPATRVGEHREPILAALDATADAFILLGPAGLVEASNAGAAAIFGRDGQPITGTRFVDLLATAAAHPIGREIESALGGTGASFDIRLRDGRGWYAAHAYPLSSGAFVHLHDVTDRHNLESRLALLAEAGDTLAAVMDEEQLARAVGQLVVPHIADWAVVAIHTSATSMYLEVAAADELVRDHLRARMEPAQSNDTPPRLCIQAAAARRPVLLSRDAGDDAAEELGLWTHAASILLAPLPVTAGPGAALILGHRDPQGFAHDVGRLATTLGTRAALVLDKVRLLGAERRATRLRDDVLAIVAHDLRAPLNTVVLGATALFNGERDDQLHDTARRSIVAAADQMNRLLEDLLDAARLDAGWAPRRRLPVQIGRLVDEAATAFIQQAVRDGIGFVVDAAAVSDDVIDVDASRVGEALSNLLDNAFKFTPRGGTVRLEAARASRGIRISVTDTGAGIEPGTVEHLFDRFWQARRNRRAGAGLGLFITRRIVEGHGGRIWAESQPGEGSAFHLVLPTAEGMRAAHVAPPDEAHDRA
jgi:signal transduction histidine kinase